MGMPIHVCIQSSLQIAKRSAIRKAQRRIGSGHAVWGLVEPAVWPDLSLVRGGAVENYFALMGAWILDSGPGVSFSARSRPTPLFALQDICREGTKG